MMWENAEIRRKCRDRTCQENIEESFRNFRRFAIFDTGSSLPQRRILLKLYQAPPLGLRGDWLRF